MDSYQKNEDNANIISKDKYILDRVKQIVHHCVKENKSINSLVLEELIDQWSFDYKMEKEYRPEVLKTKFIKEE